MFIRHFLDHVIIKSLSKFIDQNLLKFDIIFDVFKMSTDKTILISSKNISNNHEKHGMRIWTKIVDSFKETQIAFNFQKAAFF